MEEAEQRATAPPLEGKPDKEEKQCKKKKKDKRKKKKKNDKQQSSSSSSCSSSSSDDEGGVLRAMEPWRCPLYSPSASFRQLDVVSGSHQHTISRFSLARAMGCGTRLCSDLFEVCGMRFRCELYPAGFTADTCRHVSAFITTPGCCNPNHIYWEVAILDQSGKDRHIAVARSVQGRGGRIGPMLTSCRGVVAAIPRLAKAKVLEKEAKRYLPHDTLVLRATVHVLQGWASAPVVHQHSSSAMMMGHHHLPPYPLPNAYSGAGPYGCSSPYAPLPMPALQTLAPPPCSSTAYGGAPYIAGAAQVGGYSSAGTPATQHPGGAYYGYSGSSVQGVA